LNALSHYRDVLPNGLRVVTVEVPHLHSALIALYVRSGSRHEAPEKMGVSHFLEHMFFRGSERFPDTVRMNALVEAAGGNLNGVTSRDHGYYFTPLHPAEIDVGFEVLGDMLTRPLLVEVETERQIILEEMLDEVDEDGRDIDIDNLSKVALFDGHPLSHKVAGTPRTVRKMALEDLVAHHRRMYCAQNLVLCCAGNVARARVLELAAKHFGDLPPGSATVDEPPPPPPPGPVVHLHDHEDSPQTELRLNFPAPPEHHPDFPALLLARRILDDGLSSRLPFEVVEKRGLAYELHAGIDTFSDLSVFEVEAATAHAKVPKVVETIAQVLGEFCDRGPTDEELARAQRRHRMFLEFSLDSCAELAGWFGGTELWRPAESFPERIARVEAVTAADLRRVASKVLSRKNLHLVLVGRGGSRAEARLRRLCAELPLPLG
jgi:predicted Zn-dependent peptidase